ncbi:hypothetical protein KAR91_52270 [Candidatus Pacearchaeota archaeon]|nr:hypothetical protein [Candidatus Pacearchaeota archaeon]
MKKKDKAKYLRKKKLKQNARRRESEHVVDYTVYNPVRDEPVKSNRRSLDTGMVEMMLMMQMMRKRSSRTMERAIMKKELEDEI